MKARSLLYYKRAFSSVLEGGTLNISSEGKSPDPRVLFSLITMAVGLISVVKKGEEISWTARGTESCWMSFDF